MSVMVNAVRCSLAVRFTYVGYLESKYHLRVCLAHPQDCPFAHVQ